MTMTNAKIAAIILQTAAVFSGKQDAFRIEEVDVTNAPYEGAVLLIEESDDETQTNNNYRAVHVYLCDDDGQAIWMLDACDHATGEVNPKPLTAQDLEEAVKWMLAGNAA